MAVQRFKLTKVQYNTLTNRLKPQCGDRRVRLLWRELNRAHDRPGLLSEVDRRELEILLENTTDLPELHAIFSKCHERIVEGEAREQENTRRLRAYMDARRNGTLPPAA